MIQLIKLNNFICNDTENMCNKMSSAIFQLSIELFFNHIQLRISGTPDKWDYG